jgi:outer membrane protein W
VKTRLRNGVLGIGALLALLPVAAGAQVEHRLRLQGTWSHPTDQFSEEDEDGDVEIAADDEVGIRLAYELLFSERWGVELAAGTSTHDVEVDAEGPFGGQFTIGELRVTPVTASLLYHFAPQGRTDFYLGGGLAYVDYGDFDFVDGGDDSPTPSAQVDADLTYTLQAGVDIELTEAWGLAGNVQWIDTDADIEDEALPFAPLVVGAGVALRF